MPEPDPTKCWICRVNEAKAGEHMIKHSDLQAIFGKAQNQQLYFHDLERPNRKVQSLRSKMLHSPVLICADCNSTRTQPHDHAWEQVSNWLRNRQPPIRVGDFVRGNRIFRYDTKRRMRDVHLYFLKQLGCLVLESKDGIPIDVSPIADLIMNDRAHPEVYLQFGKGDGTVGRLVKCLQLESGHVLVCLFYRVGILTVNVVFAQSGANWEALSSTWHPRRGSNMFIIADFRWNSRTRRDRRISKVGSLSFHSVIRLRSLTLSSPAPELTRKLSRFGRVLFFRWIEIWHRSESMH